jgi:hypothetical protein
MFNSEPAYNVLRSALWGQTGPDGRQERVVDWQTAKGTENFLFTGGVIITANCRLDDSPLARALGTRVDCLEYKPTNAEVAALMRHIAGRGHTFGPHVLPPGQCLEVADVIVARSARLTRNLDLRLLVNTLQDRLQYELGQAEVHWTDLLECRMQGRAVPPTRPLTRVRRERDLALSIAHLPRPERLARWQAETGKSQASMYRVLNAVSQDSHGENLRN